jgi:glutathione peroxidase
MRYYKCIYGLILCQVVFTGLTKTNYKEMQQLYDKFSDKGLEILAFPCNTFYQESGSSDEIIEFAEKRGVTFPLMEKVDCSLSESAHPVFPFLCTRLPDPGNFGIGGDGIKWNFTKFLCDRNGVPVKRYGPTVHPLAIELDIIALLPKE